MATVRMSSNLRYEILNNVEKMFKVRIDKLRQEVEGEIQSMHKQIADAIIPADVVNELAKSRYNGYVVRNSYVPVQLIFSKKHNLQFRLNLSPELALKQRNGYVETISIGVDNPIYKVIQDVFQPYMNLVDEKDTLLEQIKKLLNQATTLKRLIEVWPSALEFVDSETRTRHAEKTTYTKNTEEIVIDQDTKVNLLKARMLSESI